MAHLLRNTSFGCGMSKKDCNNDLRASKAAKAIKKLAKKQGKTTTSKR